MNCQCCHVYYHRVDITFVWGNICAPLQTKLILGQLPGLSSFCWKRFSLSTNEALIESPWPSLQKLPWFWIWTSSCLDCLTQTRPRWALCSASWCAFKTEIWEWRALSQQHPVPHCFPHPHQGWDGGLFIWETSPMLLFTLLDFFPFVFIVSLLGIMNWSRFLSVWFIWLLMMWSNSGPLGLRCCCFNKHISSWWGHWHTFYAFMVQWS